jgi:hypothetical protein
VRARNDPIEGKNLDLALIGERQTCRKICDGYVDLSGDEIRHHRI